MNIDYSLEQLTLHFSGVVGSQIQKAFELLRVALAFYKDQMEFFTKKQSEWERQERALRLEIERLVLEKVVLNRRLDLSDRERKNAIEGRDRLLRTCDTLEYRLGEFKRKRKKKL